MPEYASGVLEYIEESCEGSKYYMLLISRKYIEMILLIMAAGIGSRFGTGIKQLEPVDNGKHIVMDY